MEHIELAKKVILEKEGTFIKQFYRNKRYWVVVKCKEGHEWETRAYRISKEGRWCKFCSCKAGAKRRFPKFLEECQKIAEEKGGKCLSTEYNGISEKLKWQCVKGHTWETNPTIVKKGHWCPKCAYIQIGLNDSRRLNIELMHEWAIQKEGKCLETKYKNIRTEMKWECKEGHQFTRTPGRIRQGAWCRRCAYGTDRLENEFYEVVYEKGGKIIDGQYQNAYSEFTIECKEGHQWISRPHTLKDQNTWCKQCSAYLNEKRTRKVFELLFGVKFPTKRPKWLLNKKGNKLELDGYNRQLGLAFEYNGIQHYEFLDKKFFHKNEEEFIKQQRHDDIKKKLCNDKGITLIIVPYTVNMKNMHSFIVQELQKNNIEIPYYDSNFDWKILMNVN